MDWRPTASRDALVRRAGILAAIRAHFAATGALEVETPLLGRAGAGDPAIASCPVDLNGRRRWLQTSPEAAMKRLLAAGSGDLYQICKAFRLEEDSPLHRLEFTLVEWYRCGLDHHGLMDEVALLVGLALPGRRFERATCAELARRCGAPDPHLASTAALAAWAAELGLRMQPEDARDRTLLLDLLLAEIVRHAWPPGEGGFVYDFPVEQSAYARIRDGSPPLASRFELIVDGIELANGWHEIADAQTQAARHAAEDAARRQRGLPAQPADPALLAALASGLPDCAGVALGIDRLVMLALGLADIGGAMAFGTEST